MTATRSLLQLGTSWSIGRIVGVITLGLVTMTGAAMLEPSIWINVYAVLYVAGAIIGSLAISSLGIGIYNREYSPADWFRIVMSEAEDLDRHFGTRDFLFGLLFECFSLCLLFYWPVSMIQLAVNLST